MSITDFSFLLSFFLFFSFFLRFLFPHPFLPYFSVLSIPVCYVVFIPPPHSLFLSLFITSLCPQSSLPYFFLSILFFTYFLPFFLLLSPSLNLYYVSLSSTIPVLIFFYINSSSTSFFLFPPFLFLSLSLSLSLYNVSLSSIISSLFFKSIPFSYVPFIFLSFAQSAGAVEYTDCFSVKG